MLMDKSKFRSVQYAQNDHQARLMVNKKEYRSMLQLNEELYEIEMDKPKYTQDLPIVLGFFVLQYAKMRMLEFHYDFLMAYFEPSSLQQVQMDTDSSYFAIAAKSLEDMFKNNEMERKYMKAVYESCGDENYRPNSDNGFLPRACHEKCRAKDNLTPGFFKLECDFTCIVALCSKCYACENEDMPDDYKFSSKGLNKRSVIDKCKKSGSSIVELYKRVLDTGIKESVINRGIRTFGNQVMTYSQKRGGLSFFYIKRIVEEDGISTRPLDVTLTPYKSVKLQK